MSPSVSVKNFRDADAIYAHLNKLKDEIMPEPFFQVKEADIQPGTVFLSHNPLADGINWDKSMAPIMLVGHTKSNEGSHTEKRKKKEINENGETLWMSSSTDGRWTKFTTTRKVDSNKITLASYLPKKKEEDITPARIRYADISSFKARVLRDAKDVACGLGMEVNKLLALAFKDASDENLLSKRNW